MKSDLPNINDLIQFGFKKCGCWIIDDGKPDFKLSDKSIENVIYAFATEEYVGYVGKTRDKLSARLRGGYKKNKKIDIYKNIKEAKKSLEVIILYYSPTPSSCYKYKNIEINLVEGLEIPLIKKFKPRWTTHGYGILKRAVDDSIREWSDSVLRLDCGLVG
jgi:hypothetical protein